MKISLRIIVLLVLAMPSVLRANEGMWLVSLLNRVQEAEMKNLGLNLTAEEIYNINNASLKDAIVRLNGGQCTGEVVSDKGLIFTNHHCAYDAIQGLATVENDILTNGFCARSLTDELPMQGFEISFLVRVEDITSQVLEGVKSDMKQEEREALVQAKLAQLSGKASEGGRYEVDAKSFFYGNEYYLFVYETFRDIRLVGNPPESVGKYGGDTDNWMWPRHTGDFSMIRIYADKDNNPADYSAENKPYKPKHFLPVNINGVEQGDFAMIMGFPGSTDRFLSSWGVKQALDITNPATVEVRDMKLKTMKKHMDADPAVRLKYAAKYASTANYWKYFIGQSKGLQRLDVYGKKSKQEAMFADWVAKDKARQAEYGKALDMIKEYYAATDANAKSNVYAVEAGLIGAELPLFAFRFGRTFEAYEKEQNPDKKKGILESLKQQAEGFYKDYDMETERDVFTELTKMYIKNIPAAQRPEWTKTIETKFKGNVDAFVKKMFASSVLVSKEKCMAFLAKPNAKVMQKDMAVMVGNSSIESYRASFANDAQEKFDVGYRLYVKGLREMNPDKQYAPDANSTMRITYGQVKDYKAADAVRYDYYTTSKGIMEKRDETNPEFVVPNKLAELINRGDYGKYANEKGELVVCFIADLDITGGNSGSPTIDGDGNLIGIAFDGNWEAMSGDIAYEPELQRTIVVDIRYVLFIVDKLMGGKNIVDELKYAKKKEKPAPTSSAAIPSMNPEIAPPAAPAPPTAPKAPKAPTPTKK
ncbi:MAG: S46 family peptidase [Flavobacteriales bacterium]|jgi:hypothetical protein